MEYMSFGEIVNAVSGQVIISGKYSGYRNVSTDTRKIEEKDIFIALRGERFNGNKYAAAASDKGASICIVDEVYFKESEINECTSVIQVKDGNQALLDLAEFYKSKLNVKVIGITGSAGKTTTKDLVASVLSGKFKVFKTEGNLNNQIGLPHMIFKLDNSYDVAVLEMGMNNRGEIHSMAKAARPDIAVITNVLRAHIGNLGTRENILAAKLEITDFFSEDNTLVINSDNDMLGNLKEDRFNIERVGLEKDSDISAYDIEVKEDFISFNICENNVKMEERFKVNVPGKYNVLNSLLAVACGRILNMTYGEIRKGLKNIETTAMRMEICKGKKFNVINDSYNANPESMKAAIDVLKNFKSKRRVAVLGTMGELGDESCRMHEEVGKYVGENGIDILIALGEYVEDFKRGFQLTSEKGKFISFGTYAEVLEFLIKKYIEKGDTILVKASRTMKFETIAEELKKSSNN
ncbi:UDP-N-acetylmuramoyl-tripeptide--D-alanyl-D-alanine ligase [Clostridium sp. AWRP]|uniref:UDP-N-acetylmuramoyl-tripeptide--D-alanyl-D- alanine ligase n=1 Tax=Clostridium sp. AWRP TaxID=2212991 RepID=UPI000FDB7F3B|nr:UDP-N-acetylmuramoyl-tripeptide--D-alanyl-D-alanine ligase [Clostridium sp. AWRP]AZV55997.1 UDP-N-acetylmuramoyl-tripeptide--D-alanyl-D-alanine ligase [Clostridium sp. AWRP]